MTKQDKGRVAPDSKRSDTGGLGVNGWLGTAGNGRTGETRPSTLAGAATVDETETPPNVRPDPGVWRGRGTGIKDDAGEKR